MLDLFKSIVMNKYITQSLKIVSFVALVGIMAGCGPTTKKPSSELASSEQNLELILRQADGAAPDKKNPLLIQAAGILLLEQRQEKALELLVHIDQRYLNELQTDTYQLYYGEALLWENPEHSAEKTIERYKASLGKLLAVTKPNAHSIDWQIRYFQSLSDSYFANANYFEAAKQRIGLDDLIDTPEQLAENNEKIWLAISQMSPEFLNQMISSFNTQRVNGWLEIVKINKTWGNRPDKLLEQISLWKQRYPLHPAIVSQPKSLQRVATVENYQPKKIAVLLPLSGRFARTGKMVHDGLIAAQYQQANVETIPSIKFYDTAQSLSGAASYRQAIQDGADFVIGPLIKKSINEIISLEQLTTPVLFLNTASEENTRHPMVYQFVFSIEDKAIQAAHRAWEQGYRKAIAFLPKDQRGQRAHVAFKDYFEQLGGELIDTEEFDDIKQLKSNVQNLLRVNESFERKRRIEQIVGRNIESKIRRRQDADFIFMIATPKEARRIKPFIDFYFALDLPVISTERVFSGVASDQLENDLNGIEFADIPLYVSEQTEMIQTRETIMEIDTDILKGTNGRFFSLGYDAYQLIPELSKLQAFPDYRWYGLSGEIGVNEQGFIHRYLTWAKFANGKTQVTKERLAPEPNMTIQPISQTDTEQSAGSAN
jgi:uncharacterized protein